MYLARCVCVCECEWPCAWVCLLTGWLSECLFVCTLLWNRKSETPTFYRWMRQTPQRCNWTEREAMTIQHPTKDEEKMCVKLVRLNWILFAKSHTHYSVVCLMTVFRSFCYNVFQMDWLCNVYSFRDSSTFDEFVINNNHIYLNSNSSTKISRESVFESEWFWMKRVIDIWSSVQYISRSSIQSSSFVTE